MERFGNNLLSQTIIFCSSDHTWSTVIASFAILILMSNNAHLLVYSN